MEKYIIDASVAAKWFFNDEPFKDHALILLDCLNSRQIKGVVPELFYSEFFSVCSNQLRKKKINFNDASKILDDLVDMPFERYPERDFAYISFVNAVRLGISVYDAVYISLAEIYAVPLVTADEVLIKACKNRFDFILPLSEL